MPKKHTYKHIKNYIESFDNYKLLSEKYKDSKTKLRIQCPEGHVFWMKYNDFQQGHDCHLCYNKKRSGINRKNEDEVKLAVESRGYKLLSVYKNNKLKIKLLCPKGHIYYVRFDSFMQGKGCLKCYKESLPNQEIIDKLSFCESIRETKDRQIEVKCTYCGGWYIPEKGELRRRIYYIEGKTNCERRFYCSQQCKDECPIFHKKLYRKGETANKDDLYTSSEYNLWRQTVLEREEYICEYCSETANTVHHEHSQKTHPHMALDPDNGIACCQECHYKYGHKTGTECSTGKLASKVC